MAYYCIRAENYRRAYQLEYDVDCAPENDSGMAAAQIMIALSRRQKQSWQIWSGLYNITIEILRALTIKLTQARARTRAMARDMARDRAMARTTDRPRLRARAMVSSRARARAWECVYV